MKKKLQKISRAMLRHMPIPLLVVSFNKPAKAQEAPYSFGLIPASVSEIDVAFPIYEQWKLSGQLALQMVTQGAYTNSNPFAYVQRFVYQPKIEYAGIKNLKLFLAYTHNQKYEIKEARNAKILEHRFIIMGTFSQTLTKATVFEQLRFETKFFDDRNGIHRTIPRVRARIGINHSIVQHKAKPWFTDPTFSYYTELILKFASNDYAAGNFDIFRQSVYYSAGITRNLHVAIGIIGQIQQRSSGKQFDIFYGPILSFKYSFKKKPHITFENIDGGAD